MKRKLKRPKTKLQAACDLVEKECRRLNATIVFNAKDGVQVGMKTVPFPGHKWEGYSTWEGYSSSLFGVLVAAMQNHQKDCDHGGGTGKCPYCGKQVPR